VAEFAAMALAAGARLGPYEVVASLGAGGVGEVYRARGTKLNRGVALKILPDAFVHDPDRLARFKREAHVLASLNHPNIAAIYGFERLKEGLQACGIIDLSANRKQPGVDSDYVLKIRARGRVRPGRRGVVRMSPASTDLSIARPKPSASLR